MALHGACARVAQLPPVFRGPRRVARRHLADAHGDGLARLRAHRRHVSSGCRRFFRSVPDPSSGAVCGRTCRPLEPSPGARDDPGAGDGSIGASCPGDPHGRRHRRTPRLPRRISGGHQRVRHAGATSARGRHDSEALRPAQRDCAQLVACQRGKAHRAFGCRHPHRRRRRRAVLSVRRGKLSGGDRIVAGDAAARCENREKAQTTVLIGGIASFLAGVVFFVRLPKLRTASPPIHIERGILPEDSSRT